MACFACFLDCFLKVFCCRPKKEEPVPNVFVKSIETRNILSRQVSREDDRSTPLNGSARKTAQSVRRRTASSTMRIVSTQNDVVRRQTPVARPRLPALSAFKPPPPLETEDSSQLFVKRYPIGQRIIRKESAVSLASITN